MLPECEHCSVAVHPNWEFCRRCGNTLSPDASWPEPPLIPEMPLLRLSVARAEAGVVEATRSLRRAWHPLNTRVTHQLEQWQRRLWN